MSKLFLFFLLIIFSPVTVSAQLQLTDKKYPDSLLSIAKNAKSDSIKARFYYKLSFYWADKDTLKSKQFLVNGYKYGEKYPLAKALYYYFLGGYYYRNNVKKSEENYLAADKLLSKISTKEAWLFRAKSWDNYAHLQQLKDNEVLMAQILLDKCIPFAKRAGDDEFLGTCYWSLGLVFKNQLQYDKAEKYFQLAYTIFEKTKLKDNNLLGQAYLSIIKNGLVSNKLKYAEKKLDTAKNILVKYPNKMNEAEYYLIESLYYQNVKLYNKALESIEKGLLVAKQLTNPYPTEKLNFEKYKVLTEKSDYKAAIDVIENILKKHWKYSINTLAYYRDLAKLYEKLGNDKMAYNWLKNYTQLNDSLNKQDVLRKINTLEIKYKSAENQKKITELKVANEKANLSARNSHLLNWLLGTTSLLILSAFVFGLYYYRNQKKLTAQNEQIVLAQAMLQGEEKERNRIARDLHDGLGNMLAVVKFNLANFAKEQPNAEINDITHQLDNSVTELRRIAHDMMPEMLVNIGLDAALKDLCESLTSDKMEVDYQFINIKNTIPQQIQIAIYRIVQELLTNVVKHAQAKNVFLQCTQNKQFFFITLEDDGKGFDTNMQYEKTGIGLSNIKSRVAYLNGKIEILSNKNQQGTSINIELNVKA